METRISNYLDERFIAMEEQLAAALGDGYTAFDHAQKAALRDILASVIGDVVGLIKKGKDVHERVVQQIVLTALDAIVGVGTDERIFFWNRGAELTFGYGSQEVLGRPFGFLVPDDEESREEVVALKQETAQRGFVRNFKTRRRTKDGRILTVTLSRTLIRDEAGGILGTIIIFHDITELQLLERQVLQSEKLALLGQIAAGIAHEIGTPLNIISGLAECLLLDRDAKHPEREDLEAIIGQTDRIANLIRGLLAFARPQPMSKIPVDLAVEVRRAASLLHGPLSKERIEISFDLARDLPEISADPHQLQQVLLNFLVNAADALSALPTECERRIAISTALDETHQDAKAIVLRVADNGPGVPAALSERIFDPFVTTKDVGQGTGLGLAVCRRIVEDHGGTIALENGEPGAVFVVRFPAPPEG